MSKKKRARPPQSLVNKGFVRIVDNVDNPYTYHKKGKKNPHLGQGKNPLKNVDNVDNYLLSRFSPTKYTSPAPIVINRSLLIRFFSKNFSQASNEPK